MKQNEIRNLDMHLTSVHLFTVIVRKPRLRGYNPANEDAVCMTFTSHAITVGFTLQGT